MIRRGVVLLSVVLLAACTTTRETSRPVGSPHYKVGEPYKINGKTYVPREDPGYEAVGTASWYGDAFDGKRTANGEIFDKNRLSAAHTTLPLPSLVEVENLENGRRVVVRVNDRGPFVGDRVIDMSHGAAKALDFERAGLAKVKVRYLGRAELADLAPVYGSNRGTRVAAATPAPAQLPPAAAAPTTGETTVLSMAPVDSAALPPVDAAPSATVTPVTDASSIEMGALEPIPGTRVRGETLAGATEPAASSASVSADPIESLIEGALQTPAPRVVRRDYWVTVAQFFGLSELEGAMKNLAGLGSLRMVSDAGGVGYRLQMGPYPDEASANATLAALREAGYPDAIIADEICYASPAESNLATC